LEEAPVSGGSSSRCERDLPAAALKRIAYKASAERMLTLGDSVDLVAGRTALVLELKSRFDGVQQLPKYNSN
jgi:glycerophosphoryl diester phosphodiesterase